MLCWQACVEDSVVVGAVTAVVVVVVAAMVVAVADLVAAEEAAEHLILMGNCRIVFLGVGPWEFGV